MASEIQRYKPSRGSMVVLGLAVTLIAALAIPKAAMDSDSAEPEARPHPLTASVSATVKRLEVANGAQVIDGQLIATLIDPKLEDEISLLEERLKAAELESLTAVVEPGMLGVIGSLPRVIWEQPEPVANDPKEPVASTPTSPEASAHRARIKSSQVEEKRVEAQMEALKSRVDKAEADQREFSKELQTAEANVANLQANLDAAQAQQAKHQRLYDLGAIPKRQLDEAVSAAESALLVLDAAKLEFAAKTNEAEAHEKESVEQRALLAQLADRLNELRRQASVPQTEPSKKDGEVAKTQSQTSKPIKRIVYGTAPQSFAPVKVNLIEDDSPSQTREIDQIRSKLLTLRSQRERFKVFANRAGTVVWLIEPGSMLSAGDRIAEIR